MSTGSLSTSSPSLPTSSAARTSTSTPRTIRNFSSPPILTTPTNTSNFPPNAFSKFANPSPTSSKAKRSMPRAICVWTSSEPLPSRTNYKSMTPKPTKPSPSLAKSLATVTALPAKNPPKDFQAELRPYQLDGFRWLHFLASHELNGILADDMGLGKTVQTLAYLATLPRRGKNALPSLIVAPTSVIANWSLEAERFTPKLKTLLLQGLGPQSPLRANSEEPPRPHLLPPASSRPRNLPRPRLEHHHPRRSTIHQKP